MLMIFIRFFAYAVIGNVALLMLLWLLGTFLPKAPPGVAKNTRQSWQSTIDDDYQGNDDLYRLDRSLMEAELDHPGSTLRIYYHSMPAVIARVLGSTLVTFVVAAWVLGVYEIACFFIGVLVFGFCLLLYPFLIWFISKPRVVG
jgi:hypothetical protein